MTGPSARLDAAHASEPVNSNIFNIAWKEHFAARYNNLEGLTLGDFHIMVASTVEDVGVEDPDEDLGDVD